MNRVYHIKFETDKEADTYSKNLASNHILCHVSFGFGTSPAIVVAYTDNPEVFGDVDYQLVYDSATAEHDNDVGHGVLDPNAMRDTDEAL